MSTYTIAQRQKAGRGFRVYLTDRLIPFLLAAGEQISFWHPSFLEDSSGSVGPFPVEPGPSWTCPSCLSQVPGERDGHLCQDCLDRASAAEDCRLRDLLCSGWVEDAPRFGAVAAHFPESLRKRRFVASFWAPEVLLFGDFYQRRFTRMLVDQWISDQVNRAPRLSPESYSFWSPELPALPQRTF